MPELMGNNHAYEAGKSARERDAQRVSPYYGVREVRGGRRVDVTAERDRYWYAGYDGQPEPKECGS